MGAARSAQSWRPHFNVKKKAEKLERGELQNWPESWRDCGSLGCSAHPKKKKKGD